MHDFTSEAPSFVGELDAWVLSTFADVSAALRDPRLSPSPSPMANAPAVRRATDASTGGSADPRIEARGLPWMDGRGLDERLRGSATVRMRALQAYGEVDLIRDFAAPWSLDLAAAWCGIESMPASTLATLSTLSTLAREAFIAAAHAREGAPTPHGSSALLALARALASRGAAGPLDVQAFVALTHTLPCTLGNVWLALIAHPDQMRELRDDRALMPRAVEELLRFAAPSRAVFRYAHERTLIGGTPIEPGARVVLLLADANRDAARFIDAHRLDVRRDAAGHLAFGRATHGCVGAGLIRSAVRAATEALLEGTTSIELAGEVEWVDGFAIRGVTGLPVALARF